MDMISILIWLLTTFLMTFFWGTSTSVPVRPPDPPLGEGTFHSPTNITNVDVIVMESFPMQVSLHITGEQPDGCDFPVIVEQVRAGNTVTVSVYREVPLTVMCPMMLTWAFVARTGLFLVSVPRGCPSQASRRAGLRILPSRVMILSVDASSDS